VFAKGIRSRLGKLVAQFGGSPFHPESQPHVEFSQRRDIWSWMPSLQEQAVALTWDQTQLMSTNVSCSRQPPNKVLVHFEAEHWEASAPPFNGQLVEVRTQVGGEDMKSGNSHGGDDGMESSRGTRLRDLSMCSERKDPTSTTDSRMLAKKIERLNISPQL
jgi:hypothetical protein